MRMKHLRNALSRERLLPKPSLDVIEHLSMRRIGLVQNIFQTQVRRPKTVTEVLSKDPTAIY